MFLGFPRGSDKSFKNDSYLCLKIIFSETQLLQPPPETVPISCLSHRPHRHTYFRSFALWPIPNLQTVINHSSLKPVFLLTNLPL
jgi:hypothetical protein